MSGTGNGIDEEYQRELEEAEQLQRQIIMLN